MLKLPDFCNRAARLAPGACRPASGARCALWRELLALGPRRCRRPGACSTTLSQQPPDRRSANAYLVLPPIYATEQVAYQVGHRRHTTDQLRGGEGCVGKG